MSAGKLPSDIPRKPQETFRNKGWLDFGDWLGIDNSRSSGKRKWREFGDARMWARAQGVTSHNWRSFVKSKDFLKDIPMTPDRIYANSGWNGWKDFLGTP